MLNVAAPTRMPISRGAEIAIGVDGANSVAQFSGAQSKGAKSRGEGEVVMGTVFHHGPSGGLRDLRYALPGKCPHTTRRVTPGSTSKLPFHERMLVSSRSPEARSASAT